MLSSVMKGLPLVEAGVSVNEFLLGAVGEPNDGVQLIRTFVQVAAANVSAQSLIGGLLKMLDSLGDVAVNVSDAFDRDLMTSATVAVNGGRQLAGHALPCSRRGPARHGGGSSNLSSALWRELFRPRKAASLLVLVHAPLLARLV